MARTKSQQSIIRKPEVRARTGLSDSQIWRLEARGEFPARVLLSPSGIAVGWRESEVEDWVETRPRRGGKQPPLPKSRREVSAAGKRDDRARRGRTSNRGQIADH